VIFCDSNWAGDPETSVSVTGFIIYSSDIAVCWQSKSQKGETLLSIEVKYVAISEADKEVKFVYYFLYDLYFKVNLKIVLRADNIGASQKIL
jgi:hypothetical protein